jgi:hypothetical protein
VSEEKPSTTPAPPDAYEAEYMSAEGGVLHERRRMPGWFFALMGVVALIELAASIATRNPLPALLAVPILGAVTLLLSHLRVVLSETHLHIQYGLWGPKVAIADITSVRVERYSMMRYGGFGIRRSIDGVWAYSTPGGNGDALVIEARDGRGGTRKICITLDQAERFRQVIEDLRARAAGTDLRIDVGAAAPAAEPAELVREDRAVEVAKKSR